MRLHELDEEALFVILNEWLTTEEICLLKVVANGSKSTSLDEKLTTIMPNLAPRHEDLVAVGYLQFLIKHKIPVGSLRFLCSCLETTDESSHDVLLKNLHALLPQVVGTDVKVQFEADLSLNRYVDNSFLEVVATVNNLRHLDLRYCPEITDHGMMLVSRLAPELRYVDISHTHYPGEENLTDISVISLSFGCTKLEEIVLEEMDAISDTAIMSLSLGCPGLKKINAFYCDRLGDISICSLGKRCHLLEELNIMYSDISDKAVRALSDGCPLLRYLNIALCDTVTDISLVYMASKCLQLQKLNLRGLPYLTDKAVSALCSSLTKLWSIVLTECPGLRDASIAALCKPPLRHLELPSNLYSFNEDAIIRLAESQPSLETFVPHRYLRIHDAVAVRFAACCPLLQNTPFKETRESGSRESSQKSCK